MLSKDEFTKKTKLKGRTRNYSVVFYPENLENDFFNTLEKCQVKCVLSPLHDKDLNDMGEVKKAHYHFIFCFDSVKEPYQAYEFICSNFGENSFSIIQKVNSMSASVRYLAHLDCEDEKKYKYNVDDIKVFNGFDLNKYLYSEVNKVASIKRIRSIIKDYDFIYFDDLFQYAEDNNDDELLNILLTDSDIRSTTFEILRSREYRFKAERSGVNPPRFYRSSTNPDKCIFNRELKQA